MINKKILALSLAGTNLIIPSQAKERKDDRPNVVMIVVDDMGYSDIGSFGGEIPTPHIDGLAENGLRFSQFYSMGRSCPTRASLMTGLFQHQAGIGQMSEDPTSDNIYKTDWGTESYKGYLNRNCVTIAEVLKSAGYHTYMTGKWHLGMHGQEKWPLQRGFDRYYGTLSGASSYFKPNGGRGITFDNEKQEAPTNPDYYTTDVYTDYALDFVDSNIDSDAPFFLYLCYNAPHWPLQAKEKDIEKFVKLYQESGWGKIQYERRRRMIKMGIIEESWGLGEWESRNWDELTAKEREECGYRMAVYAAQVHCVDYNLARLFEYLKEKGEYDNTLFLFISDNGGCAEPYAELGGQAFSKINNPSYSGNISYGLAWAQVSNTPFRKYKVRQYEGGLSVPLIISWKDGIKKKYNGEIRKNIAGVQDIMPTIIEAVGAKYPKTFHDGNTIKPLVGTSILPAISDKNIKLHDFLFWEHQNYRAVRGGDWKAIKDGRTLKWELYNIAKDRAEKNNLSEENPEKLEYLVEKWEEWAKLVKVEPKQYKPNMMSYENPILSGFYPDPSICRVGEDYYLINSSFEWFPGIPIFHSKDLINWKQIGNVLNRPSQLMMKEGMKASAGVWAPTIRYNNGKFYVIVTSKQAGNMFYVTSENPSGEWSDPVYLKDAPGIDPSLFFDEDGKVWLCANANIPKNEIPEGASKNHLIWLQELDIIKGKLLGKRYTLTHGLHDNSIATEAPHIYKIGKKYFLLTAEGMTWNNHAVAMFSSDHITGPYTACYNGEPAFTHRTLPKQGGDITTVGHADLVQTQHGEWWAVLLGVRPIDGNNMLGRETFLVPVEINKKGIPVFAPDSGKVVLNGLKPILPISPIVADPVRDDFDAKKLRFCWNTLRTPINEWWKLDSKNSKLILPLRKEVIEKTENPSLIAQRVRHHKFDAATCVEFTPQTDNEEAGMVIMQNNYNFYKLVITKTSKNSNLKTVVKLVKSDTRKNNIYEVVASKEINSDKVFLGIKGNFLEYTFYVGETEDELKPICPAQDATVCSSNRAGGFTGPYIGMYASGNGKISTNWASFDWFDYSGK